ncbi:SPOR domain-containing protein [Pseudodesulfovibrio sp. zrk46]|uniref:SPOR domain-containing protein n=1 Tax=Pseudodesulfovibrio sp. zrk46 TaxID=2725288 RepID=UPI0014494FF5|nr:SPOR domain-containing protein [Pseudodesulfovibrio sp. zrk46]QJB55851.1 hypothetical protein HFN16_05265 [Pseudodesulfovibrio sp. zrk46]
MKKTTKSVFLFAVTLTVMCLMLAGCFRKHITSAPPARRPASDTSAPAPKVPVVVEGETAPEAEPEAAVVIEETYVVDAPAEASAAAPKVEEGELAEEATIAPPEEAAITQESTEAKAMQESVTEAQDAPVPTPMAEMYYVQVGAFSDLENASNLLSKLIAEGYKGSKLSDSGNGLYRVQAGAFTEEADAIKALMDLQGEYPNGFVLKSRPVE